MKLKIYAFIIAMLLSLLIYCEESHALFTVEEIMYRLNFIIPLTIIITIVFISLMIGFIVTLAGVKRDCEKKIYRLWKALDDIDTLEDICKENDKAFRRRVYDIHRERFHIISEKEVDKLYKKFYKN